MAAYTSTGSGAGAGPYVWSSPTLWQVAGANVATIPGAGDTVTLSKSVTVDVNVTVGASNGQYVSGTTAAAIQLNSGGRLIVAAGIKLTLRGDITINTGYNIAAIGITLNAGAILEWDSSTTSPTTTQYRMLNLATNNQPGMSLVCNGTLAAPCYVQSNAGGANGRFFANGYTSAYGGLTATYTYFLRLGTAAASWWDIGLNVTVSPMNCTNCTFDGCSWINVTSAAAAAGYFNFTNCVFQNSLAAYNLNAASYLNFKQIVMDKTINCGAWVGASFDTVYFNQIIATAGANSKWALFTNCYVRITSVNSGFATQGDMQNSLFMSDYLLSNPHWVLHNGYFVHTYDGLIGEYSNLDDQGDFPHFNINKATITPGTFYTRRCLILPGASNSCSGDALTLQGPQYGCQVDLQHNTFIVGSQGGTMNEATSCPINTIANYKNNLAWDFPAVSPRGFVLFDVGHLSSSTDNGGLVTDTVLPANADYNAHFNCLENGFLRYATPTWYVNSGRSYFAAFSSVPGVHDIIGANPMFVDATRNTPTFDSAYLKNAASIDWAAAPAGYQFNVGDIVSFANTTLAGTAGTVGYFYGASINYRCLIAHTKGQASTFGPAQDYTSAWRNYWEFATYQDLRNAVARGAAGLPLTYTDAALGLVSVDLIKVLWSWIRAGFAPQNTSLRGAASDGTDIGAVPVVGASQAISLLGCS